MPEAGTTTRPKSWTNLQTDEQEDGGRGQTYFESDGSSLDLIAEVMTSKQWADMLVRPTPASHWQEQHMSHAETGRGRSRMETPRMRAAVRGGQCPMNFWPRNPPAILLVYAKYATQTLGYLTSPTLVEDHALIALRVLPYLR